MKNGRTLVLRIKVFLCKKITKKLGNIILVNLQSGAEYRDRTDA